MLGRRDLFLTATGLALAACSKSKPIWPRKSVRQGIELTDLFPNGADESSPLVVAIHGRGDKPENWIPEWSNVPFKAQIVLPRAFLLFGDGFSWFDLPRFGVRFDDVELGKSVAHAESRLWKVLSEVAGDRRLIVTGFSQGGILSFQLAAKHGDRIHKAFPVAGLCPSGARPKKGDARAAPVLALHGLDDDVIPFEQGGIAVTSWQEAGYEAQVVSYPRVGHEMTAEMRARLYVEIQRALA